MSFAGELLVIETLKGAAVDELVAAFGVLPIEPNTVSQRVAVAGDTI